MEKKFKGFTIEYIDRNKNSKADEPFISRCILTDHNRRINKNNRARAQSHQHNTGEDSWAPIIAYLCHYYEPDSTVEQTRIQQRAQSYQIVDIDLYKISVSGPLLRCVSKDEGRQILSEIHAGVCGGHIGAKALAAKILQQGFY
jgi:hypothetical protein